MAHRYKAELGSSLVNFARVVPHSDGAGVIDAVGEGVAPGRLGERVWIEDHSIQVAASEIVCGPRVGIDYAGDDAHLPYRFRIGEI